MSRRLLLVDYENVQVLDFAALPADVAVQIFLGSKQKTLKAPLVMAAQPFGPRVTYVQILEQASNALDFHIAFALGVTLTNHPDTECVILSKDKKGFDPLVKHLIAQEFVVKRVDTQVQAYGAGPAAAAVAATPAKKKKKAVAKKAAPKKAASAPKPLPPATPTPRKAKEADYERVLRLLTKDKARPKTLDSLKGKLGNYFRARIDVQPEALLERLMREKKVVADSGSRLTYFL